jgi:hypothetical protein
MSAQEFDVIVYGASGFTGKLVAEHLLNTYGAEGEIRWAIAGRDEEKLKAVRTELNAPFSLPIIIAGANDSGALDALAHRTRVVITTVGPYQRYGEGLLAACVRAGTDYVDLCGEPNWMAAMIKRRAHRVLLRLRLDPLRLRRVVRPARSPDAFRPTPARRACARAQNERHVLRRHGGVDDGDVRCGPERRSGGRVDDGPVRALTHAPSRATR